MAKKLEKRVESAKIYTFQEAVDSATEYFNGDKMAAKNWVNKYALKDSHQNIYEKSPEEMHERLIDEFVRLENKYENPLTREEIAPLIKNFKYLIPGGSIMSGLGNDYQVVSLSNCFVIGNGSDSYGGIINIDEEQVQLMKRRGGVGHDLSHIRPKRSPVKNTALTSTGVVPFMERYSNSTREVAQDGRRGALMLSLDIKHPDAEDFIDAKMTPGKITGANVSIKLDDEFMNAAMNGEKYIQKFPIDSDNPKLTKEIDAKKLWNKIIHNAWDSAEPGILFWDTIMRESIADSYVEDGFKTLSTNPCGEIPLCAYDSCRLLAMNLYSYVEKPFTKDAYFNEELFSKHSRIAQRIMDDVVEAEIEKADKMLEKIASDPEPKRIKANEMHLWKQIKEKAIQGRRTGLGITGEGDMLAALGMRYGSSEAIDFSVYVHKTLALEAYRSSTEMAEERGAFTVYDFEKEKNNPFIQRIQEEDPELYAQMKEHGRRNISLLTIAPTGTVSQMTQTTSGIEPAFLPVYKRRRKVNPNDKEVKISFTDKTGDSWEEYNVFHHHFETWLKVNGHNVDEVKNDEKKLEELVKFSPYYKATSNDVNWVDKVKMQGAIQEWVDHSISVTVNLPKDVTEETVSKVYEEGWRSGCKGITVYRDGSREGVLISGKEESKKGGLEKIFPEKRPDVLDADVYRFMNSNGKPEKWIAFVGKIEEKPYEIFLGKAEGLESIPSWVEKGEIIKVKNGDNKSRYDFSFKDKQGYDITMGGLSRSFDEAFWNYAKFTSGVLRHEVPIIDVIKIVEGLNLGPEDNINTWKKGVVRSLSKYVPDGTKTTGKEPCPECEDKSPTWRYEDGCKTCANCGHQGCS